MFFTLFGAVAVVGVLGAGIMQTMQGPLNTMVQVNLRERANTEMSIASRLALLESASDPSDAGDCDADGFVEPLERGGPLIGLTGVGAGTLPTEISSNRNDPWGNEYGYCAWDAGTDNTDACASNLFNGDATTSEAYSVIAIISAGPDGVFQTSCSDYTGTDPVPPSGDDLVSATSYQAAIANTGGLWNVVSGDPTKVEVNKDIDLSDPSGSIGFSPQLLLGASSMILPTRLGSNSTPVLNDAGCSAANIFLLRINDSLTPPTLEVCDGTNFVSATAGAAPSALADDDTSVAVDDLAPSIVFTVDGTTEMTITPTALEAGSLNIETTGTLDAGATTITGNTDITGTFNVNGATTLDALTASGNATFNGAVSATSGMTISGGGNPSLSVTGNIAATDVNPSGDVNFGDTRGILWGAVAGITGSAVGDNIDIAANAVNMDGALNITNTGTTDPALDVTGNVDISADLDVTGDAVITGDLTVTGDDLTMGTNTDQAILVADGTNFNPVVPSGDVNISNTGVMTIQDDSVQDDDIDAGSFGTGSGSICLKTDGSSIFTEICSGGGGGDGVGAEGLPEVLANDNSANNLKIVDLADPTANQDAATKFYVDTQLGALNSDRIQDLTADTFIDVDTTNDGLTNSIIFNTASAQSMSISATGVLDLGTTTRAGIMNVTGPNGTRRSIEIKNAAGDNRVELALGSSNQGNIIVRNSGGSPTFQADHSGASINNLTGLIVGGNVIDASAELEIDSTDTGFLPPRMTTAQRDAINSGTFATGLIVYNTDADAVQVWDGTAWLNLGGSGGDAGRLIDADSDTSIQVDTAGDGSADTTVFTNDGSETMRITTGGDVGIGTASPVTKLDVTGGIRVGSVSGAAAPTYMALNDLSDTDVASPADGQALIYNTSSGNWEAADPSGSVIVDIIRDADGDTAVQVEESPDEDIIRFDVGGTQSMAIFDTYPSAPGSGFHVRKPGANADIDLRNNNSGAGRTRLSFGNQGTAGNYATIGTNGTDGHNMEIATSGTRDIKFLTNSTERMRIDSAGNVVIGTTAPDASSLLDLTSTARGFLPPRMTEAQRDAINSGTFATGLIIYNTDDDELEVFDGTNWVAFSGGGSVLVAIDDLTDAYNSTNIDHDGDADTTNDDNLALGHEFPALDATNPGARNTAIGRTALDALTTADNNIAIGYDALGENYNVPRMIAIGSEALSAYNADIGTDVTHGDIIALGAGALGSATRGKRSVAIGNSALGNWNGSTANSDNTAIGSGSGIAMLSGARNVLVGARNFRNIQNGTHNVSLGVESGAGDTGGVSNIDFNVFLGNFAASGLKTNAARNVAIGYGAGAGAGVGIGSGTDNILIGFEANTSIDDATHELNIGSVLFGNIDDTTTGAVNETSVGIGVANAAAIELDSILELDSTTRGFLAPRMTTTERDAIDNDTGTLGEQVTTGLMIYNTTTNLYQFYNGSTWTDIGSGAALSAAINDLTDGYTDANNNLALGHEFTALDGTTPGEQNIAVGQSALANVTTGNRNTAIGDGAGASVTTASNAVFMGRGAGANTTDSSFLIAIGDLAGTNAGISTIAIGRVAHQNGTGQNNVAIGITAGQNIDGTNNVFIGANSAVATEGGSGSVVIGDRAMERFTLTGGLQNNTAIGGGGIERANRIIDRLPQYSRWCRGR